MTAFAIVALAVWCLILAVLLLASIRRGERIARERDAIWDRFNELERAYFKLLRERGKPGLRCVGDER